MAISALMSNWLGAIPSGYYFCIRIAALKDLTLLVGEAVVKRRLVDAGHCLLGLISILCIFELAVTVATFISVMLLYTELLRLLFYK